VAGWKMDRDALELRRDALELRRDVLELRRDALEVVIVGGGGWYCIIENEWRLSNTDSGYRLSGYNRHNGTRVLHLVLSPSHHLSMLYQCSMDDPRVSVIRGASEFTFIIHPCVVITVTSLFTVDFFLFWYFLYFSPSQTMR
jgi:hypothetical protein